MDLGKIALGADLVAKAKLEGGKLLVVFEFEAGDVAKVLVDKVEHAIPGDQKALAEVIKAQLAAILG